MGCCTDWQAVTGGSYFGSVWVLRGNATHIYLGAQFGAASVFNGAVLREGVLLETGMFHRQRVVDDELCGHDRVHARRVTPLVGNGVTQPGQVYQRGLPQDVVAHDTGRIPRKIQLALALD